MYCFGESPYTFLPLAIFLGVVDDGHIVAGEEREGDVNDGDVAGLVDGQVLGGEEERDHLVVEGVGVGKSVGYYSCTVSPGTIF